MERRRTMPTYIGLVKLTDQGIRNVKETTKRAKSFREMAELAGLKVREILWTMGRYDLVLVVDAPDDGIDGTSSKPNLLLLLSPAVFAPKHLFQGRGNASDHSPMQHAGAATPPTCIVNGDKDTVTPIQDAQAFRERVVRAGGICELHVYPGVGHLLTRNVANQLSNFDPDPVFRADGYAQFERFLKERGYIPRK
jgi:acetyl esterase/lipase